jgi:four helix bundle protein
MMPYERFEAWQAAHRLVLNVYESTQKWPKDEWYGLRSQLRRAVVSVPTNIAEGSAKRGSREFRRYLDISIGSLSEVAYQLHLARDLGLLTSHRWSALNQLREQTSKLLWGLAESVAKR